ncbi:MAG: serine--tRNA ligase [Thermoprotei archaeon]|nr:MAG: serine--tRNA ligase [Thermoprotei archaeon]RLF21937.1 MAG: serine--tRNA ligase [Thermoprotei archaeon]
MRFKLIGWLETTCQELEKHRDVLEDIIKRANEEVLIKGAKDVEEAAKITNWSIKNNLVYVTIESGRRVRAHAAIKRLQKYMAQRLGRMKIGVRRVHCEEYVVEVEKPVERLEWLKHYDKVVGVEDLGDRVRIMLKDLSETELERGDVDRLVKLITPGLVTMKEALARKVGIIVRASQRKSMKFSEDPTEVALKLGWIARFPGRGQWYYLPPFTALLNAIKELVFEYVTRPLGFVELMLPKLIPLEIAFRARKLQGEPGGMYYVCAPRYREKEKYLPFRVKAEITNVLPMRELKDLLEDPGYILDPVQCLPFYQLYRGKVLRKEELPIKVVDVSGPTYRYEAGGARGIERVHEFWRIEHVWMGLRKQCIEIRDQVLDAMCNFVDKVLDLEWRVEFAGDTFYLAEDQRIDEDVEIPEEPKFELQIYMPFKGPRDSKEKDVWLACASFNLHGTHYTKNFSIKCASGEPLWTGCFGVGLTRMATAFLAQHGFNFDDWPEEVRRRVKHIKGLPGLV